MTPDQIENLRIADTIIDRAMSGVTRHRLIHDEEELPFVRAYYYLRETLAMMAENAKDDHERITAGMNPG